MFSKNQSKATKTL